MSKPKPSDPKLVGAAQTATNVATAQANAYLNNPNEFTPDGSKTYTQGEPFTFTDSEGKSHTIYRQNMTQTLSPAQQAIKDQQDAASKNLATLGNNLSGQLGSKLTGNFSLGNEATESRLMELGRKRLDPILEQRKEGLQSDLSNQGIKLGSTAYDRAMNQNTQGQNDAYNQLLLQGRGQANQELLTEDNQRINQIGALLSGGQVSQPNFMLGFQGPNMQNTDMASIYANYDQQNIARSNAINGSLGSAIGGLGGLFSFSDKRLKEDISKVGKTKDGQNIYSYRYKTGGPIQLGLMAQEVEKKKPEAVATHSSGFKMVDYSKALKMGA
jgi:hypothetical protein